MLESFWVEVSVFRIEKGSFGEISIWPYSVIPADKVIRSSLTGAKESSVCSELRYFFGLLEC